MQPIIAHLDMNSYFASVEQQDHPEYRDKPVGVCEHLGGIIIAASVQAKKWGIKTGTPVWEAKKLYPKIILTHTHPDRYRLYHQRMVKVVSDYTADVERYSIDEVFLDLTKATNIIRYHPGIFQSKDFYQSEKYPGSRTKYFIRLKYINRDAGYFLRPIDIAYAKNSGMATKVDPFEEAVSIAQTIKRRMKKEVGDYLTCSIGIAENKLLAKIGSDLKKPDGIVVVKPSIVCHSEQDYIGNPSEESLNFNSIDKFKYKGSLHSPSAIRSDSGRPELVEGADALGLGRDDTIDGILVLSRDDLYNRLKLTDIPGIGHRQEKNLKELGIKTVIDLKNYPKSKLVARFGVIGGHHLYNMGQLEGSWKSNVEEDEQIKSIGHMYTLPREFREKKFFVPVLYKLSEMVGKRLRNQNLMGDVLHFYLRDKNYEGYGTSKRLGYYLYDGREIFLECMRVFESFHVPSGQFKLIGVTIAGLTEHVNQLSLFGDEERHLRLVDALDNINEKYGDFTICRVPILSAGKVFRDSIGFGRLKEMPALFSGKKG